MKQFCVEKYDYIVKYAIRNPVYYMVQKLYLKTGHVNIVTKPAQTKKRLVYESRDNLY